MKNAFGLGLAFSLGLDFKKKNQLANDEKDGLNPLKLFIIKRICAKDWSQQDEDNHPRKENGQFTVKGHEGVASSIYKNDKKTSGGFKQGAEMKNRFIKSLPAMKGAEQAEKIKKALEPFAGIKANRATTIASLGKETGGKGLFVRGEKPLYEGKARDGEPLYEWRVGDEIVDKKTALALENVMRELGYTDVLSPANRDVRVRRDLATGYGQVATGTPPNGTAFARYAPKTMYDRAQVKYARVNEITEKYPKIAGQIIEDIKAGRKEAVLAYFIHITCARADATSGKNKRGTLGATSLTPENFTVKEKKVVCEFPAKNGYWKLEITQPFLFNYLTEKLKTAKKGEPIFGVSYPKLTQYLREVSEKTGLTESMMPHDFRRATATQVARDYIQAHYKPTMLKDEKAYSKMVAEAINEAARAINDTATIAFGNYISPEILFKERPEYAQGYIRSMCKV